MRRFWKAFAFSATIATLGSIGLAKPPADNDGPYKVLNTNKAGGVGGFDYVYADAAGRKLYIPRQGNPARITVFDLDTLQSLGEIPMASARGVAVDPKSGHGFGSSNPVVMFDTKTLATIKTIAVQGNPDGILFDPFNQHVHILSHSAPNDTVIDAKDGSVIGTIDLGGQPEQAVTDGNGHLYVDLEDKDSIAVVDAKTMMTTGHYSLNGKAGGPGGLAFDAKNHVLFVTCHDPAMMVILNSDNGNILATLPIGVGTDGATFNPSTLEAFSSNGDGTLTIVMENSPTSFVVEQNLQTMTGAKTLSLDSKTNRILLIAAEFGTPAAPAAPTAAPPTGGPARRPNRGPMVPGSFSILIVGKQ